MMNVFSVLYIKRFNEHKHLLNIQNHIYNTFRDMFQTICKYRRNNHSVNINNQAIRVIRKGVIYLTHRSTLEYLAYQ